MDLQTFKSLSKEDAFKWASNFSGVPADVLDGVWAAESSRGKKMLSPAGARGHFGIMPRTQAAFEQQLGVTIDPDDLHESLFVAAHHLKADLKREKGDLSGALRAYNNSPTWRKKADPRGENAAYPDRVFTAAGRTSAAAQAEVGGIMLRRGEHDGKGTTARMPAADLIGDVQRSAAKDLADQQRKDNASIGDLVGEVWDDPRANAWKWMQQITTRPGGIGQSFDYYNWEGRAALEANAQNTQELQFLRENVNEPAGGAWALKQLETYRAKDKTYGDYGAAENLLVQGGVSMADPVALFIGGVAGKAFGVSRLGLRALAGTSSRVAVAGRIVGAAAVEGAAGNAGWELAQDVTGQIKSFEDYALASSIGGVFGTALSPLGVRSALRELEPTMVSHVEAFRAAEVQRLHDLDAASRTADPVQQAADIGDIVDAGRYGGTDRRADSKVIPDELLARSVDDEELEAPPAAKQVEPEPVAAPARAAEAPTVVRPVEAAPQAVVAPVARTLPPELAKAAPRYSFGERQFTLNFADDLDRAAYIVAQSKPSKRDADYLQFVMESLGVDEAGARAYGAGVRAAIKAQAAGAEPGALTVASQRPATLQAPGAPEARPEFVAGAKQRIEDILREGLKSDAASPVKASDASMVRTAMARLLDVLPQAVKDMEFTFNKAIGTRTDTGVSGLRERGDWNPALDFGTLPGEAAAILPARDVRGRNPLAVAVHEITHAATSKVILAIQSGVPGVPAKVRRAFDRLEELRGELTAELKARGQYREGYDVGANYATKNIDEFVAQGRSDRETIEILRSMPGRKYETDNGHETFWKNLMRMMGLDRAPLTRAPVSAAEETSQLIETLMKADMSNLPAGVEWSYHASIRMGTRDGYGPKLGAPGEPVAIRSTRDSNFFRQLYEHARTWDRTHPIDTGKLDTLANKYTSGAVRDTAVSDGVKMASSKNPIVRMLAGTITEVTTGAAGRRTTADGLAHLYHGRIIGDSVNAYDHAALAWVQKNQGGWVERLTAGKIDQKFDRLVAEEIRRRYEKRTAPVDAEVAAAADAMERLFQRSLDQQKRSGTLGAAWLPDSAVGYYPQALNGDAIRAASAAERKELQDFLASHWMSTEGWDMRFAEDFAHHYVARAMREAAGERHVDHVATNGATSVVKDTLAMMRLEMRSLDARTAAEMERVGAAPSTKHRLDVPMLETLGNGKKLLDYYETDVKGLARAHARSVSGQAALAEKNILGNRGANNLLRAIREAEPNEAATPEEISAVERVFSSLLGLPWHGEYRNRLATGLAGFTRLRLMGGLVFTQLGENVNGVHHVGLSATMEAIASLPRMFSEVKDSLKGAAVANQWLGTLDRFSGYALGTEQYRMSSAFDAPDDLLRSYGKGSNIVERAIQSGNYAQAKVSFFRGLQAAQHRAFSERVVIQAVDYMTKGGPDSNRYLDDMGFNSVMRKALGPQLERAVMRDAAGNAVGFDLFKLDSTELMEDFVTAVNRGVAQIIQNTYIGEKGAWAHNDILKVGLQLRTFGLTATEKQWARNRMLAGNGVEGYAFAGGVLVAQMAFTLPIYLARLHVNSIGRYDREEYIDQGLKPAAVIQAMMNYSSAGGLAGDAFDTVASLAGGWNENLKQDLGVKSFGNGLSGIVPAFGTVDQAMRVARGDGSVVQAIKLLPFSNVPHVQAVINQAR